MKDGILILLRPFTVSQKFFVFNNGIVVREGELPMNEDFPVKISEMIFEHNLKNINLSGPHNYALGVKSVINTKLLYTYQKQDIEINILSNKK